MKKAVYSLLLLCTFVLTSCDKNNLTYKKGDIFISDISSIYKIDPISGETKKIMDGQVADLSYNQSTHSLFSVNRGEKGYTELSNDTISTCNTGLAAANYLYAYKNYVLSDSWIIHHDSTGEVMGQFGIYDSKKKELIKTFKKYGSFDAITGYKHLAYVSMFGSEKNNSNVYEVNMITHTVRSIFHTPQSRAPKIIHADNGTSYGFYKHWDTGPANELVAIDLKTGKTRTITTLDPYSFNMHIIGDVAVVVHFDEMNETIYIADCITIVDLKTGLQTKMTLPEIRPTNIAPYKEKTVAVTDNNGYLLLLNPLERKIVKKHFINEGLYFLTAAT